MCVDFCSLVIIQTRPLVQCSRGDMLPGGFSHVHDEALMDFTRLDKQNKQTNKNANVTKSDSPFGNRKKRLLINLICLVS